MRVLRCRPIIGVVLILIAAAQANSIASTQIGDLKFGDYAVSRIFKGKPAAAKLTTRRERQFRTRLGEDSQKGPNFAGHYTFVFWGCGSGCAQSAVVDAQTGKIYWVPLETTDIPDYRDATENRNYRLNSRLLILTRTYYDNRGTYEEYAFLMTRNGLRQIRKRLIVPAREGL